MRMLPKYNTITTTMLVGKQRCSFADDDEYKTV